MLEAVKNCENYVVLKTFGESFVLNKKTALKEGERIRTDVSCFTKKKVYLNIHPKLIKF